MAHGWTGFWLLFSYLFGIYYSVFLYCYEHASSCISTSNILQKMDICTLVPNARTSDAERRIIKYIRGPIRMSHFTDMQVQIDSPEVMVPLTVFELLVHTECKMAYRLLFQKYNPRQSCLAMVLSGLLVRRKLHR
jgi:hypothetical protein